MTNLEKIDNLSDAVLIRVIRGADSATWHFLALKTMLIRMRLSLSMPQHQTDEFLHRCCDEMRTLLRRSANIPNSAKDIDTIITQFGS